MHRPSYSVRPHWYDRRPVCGSDSGHSTTPTSRFGTVRTSGVSVSPERPGFRGRGSRSRGADLPGDLRFFLAGPVGNGVVFFRVSRARVGQWCCVACQQPQFLRRSARSRGRKAPFCWPPLPWALWHYWRDLSWREVTAGVMLFCGIAGAWAAYAVRTFGSVVPQSVVAKAALSDDPMLAQFSWNNVGLFFLRGQYGD